MIILAAAAAAVATNQVSQGIDVSPLIPVVNGIIATAAAIITAAIPVAAFYVIQWLRNHGIKVSNEAQGMLVKQADDLVQHGLAYAKTEADDGLTGIKVAAPNATVARAAGYAIAQAPELLAKLGFDPRTAAGQQAIIRMVTARLVPTPPVADLNATVTLQQPAAEAASTTEKLP